MLEEEKAYADQAQKFNSFDLDRPESPASQVLSPKNNDEEEKKSEISSVSSN